MSTAPDPGESTVPADKISYKTDLRHVDWAQMKAAVNADDFDNGRTPAQLRLSFENSYATVIAYAGDQIVGTARALSDGVCNAYIVDVWTLTAHRRRGIASEMMRRLFERLAGQHVYLFTDDAQELYESLGFQVQGVGMGLVVGEWLQNGSRAPAPDSK
jgi:ribosomal protein S18 acetylase RimI-like enzyme